MEEQHGFVSTKVSRMAQTASSKLPYQRQRHAVIHATCLRVTSSQQMASRPALPVPLPTRASLARRRGPPMRLYGRIRAAAEVCCSRDCSSSCRALVRAKAGSSLSMIQMHVSPVPNVWMSAQ